MPSRTPTLQEILNRLGDQIAANIRVGLPGRIEAYDPSTQLADVKPLVKDQFEEEDGTVSDVSLPVVTNVPVLQFGGGGMRLTFPMAVGDTVWLMFGDRSLDAWLNQGGETAPADARRHHISDAIAIPGLHSNNLPWSGADTGVISIGSDAGAVDFVATAERVLTELTKLKSAFDGHTHNFVAGLGFADLTTAGATPSASLAAPASATVKVRG